MMRYRVGISVGLMMVFCVGWGAFCVAAEEAVIHPLALENALCWMSDTENPVFPQISLTAIARNRNQYDYDAIEYDGKWVRSVEKGEEDGEEIYLSYYTEEGPDGTLTIHFWANYGGSFSVYTGITGRVGTKTLLMDGSETTIDIFDITGIHTTEPE